MGNGNFKPDIDTQPIVNKTQCYTQDDILQSEFPELFIAGIACILINCIFFTLWVSL